MTLGRGGHGGTRAGAGGAQERLEVRGRRVVEEALHVVRLDTGVVPPISHPLIEDVV